MAGSEGVAGVPLVRVFGGVGIDDVDGPVSIGGPQQRRLLALLTLRNGSVAEIDWLAEHLWSDADRPDATTPAIRTYMSRLRLALPPGAQEWVSTESGGYRMSAPAAALEHERFIDLRARATSARGRGDPLAAMQLLDEALALWRAEPFQELEDSGVARATVEQLQLDRLEMLEERWESALALGRHTQITGELAVFANEHRMRDRSTRQYALALHRSGRTPEALRVIASHREFLADESGLDPSPDLLELEQAMLTNDNSLAVEKVGRPLRGYRLIDEIGSGAFSIVWRGRQPSVGREVAIKQIRSELASQPEFIRRFEAEAHLVARLEHPHIVPLIDFWRDPDSAYLVMRLLRGGTLERRLDDGALSVAETLTMASQVGGGLIAAHEQGIIHRDVKTGNIMFDETGNAFLADFGIALEATDTDGPLAALSSGSPAYAAPEQLRRQRLGPEADVFSLGVVLFESLAGTLPFADSVSAAELIDRQLTAPHPPISDTRPDVPAHISDAIAKATAHEPTDRWSTVMEFLDALENGDEPTTQPSALIADGVNPYKGLRAFDDADTQDFFGRERLVTELVDRLDGDSVASRALVVVGPSGSGKSSVVRAGLVPAVRAGAVAGSQDWFVTTMVPGLDPYEALEAALLRVAVNPPTALLGQLVDGDRGILRSVRRCMSVDEHRVFLVVDQLEELFTNVASERADQFLAALTVAVKDPASPLRLVATLRADYYDRPLAHPTFAQILKETAVDVTPLAADELERAILEPARRYGVNFEPGLSARIAADSLGQTAPLPLLQYALAELFERRQSNTLTIASYQDLGGLSGALAARAESLFVAATEAEQSTIRRVFGRLASPGEHTADLRRRIALSDLANDAGAQHAVDQFGEARLLTFDRDAATREPTVEVAHEALLREWPRLAEWLQEDADLLRQVDAISLAASNWQEGGRDPGDLYRGGRLDAAVDLAMAAPDRLRDIDTTFVEAGRAASTAQRQADQAQVQRLRRLVAAVGVGLVLALLAGGFAFVQQRRANDQATRAEAQTELAATNAAEARAQAELAATNAAEARAQAELADANAAEADRQAELAVTSAAEADRQAELALANATDAQLAVLASESAAQSATSPELSLLLALELHRRDPTPTSEQVVFNALGTSSIPNRLSSLGPLFDEAGAACGEVAGLWSSLQFANSGGELVTRNVLTGEVSSHGPPPNDECVTWFGHAASNRRFAWTADGTIVWSGPWSGPWEREHSFESPWFNIGGDETARRALMTFPEPGLPTAPRTFAVLDPEDGTFVGDPIESGKMSVLGSVAISRSQSLMAVSTGSPGTGEAGSILLIDTETGQVRLNVEVSNAATAMAFDESTNELIANVSPRTLITIDLESGAVTSSVDIDQGARVFAISPRPDGRIMVLTRVGVEWLDRQTGSASSPVELPGLTGGFIRPDGTIYGFDQSANNVSVIDLDGSALVRRSLEIDPFTRVTFNDGFAAIGAFNSDTNDVEIVDVTSGDRTELSLFDNDGTPFVPISLSPEPDGVWALNLDNVFARWEGNEQVSRFEIDGEPLLRNGLGTRIGNRIAHLSTLPDGSRRASLISYDQVAPGELYSVQADNASVASPALTGGMHILDSDGTLRTFDDDGELADTITTPATNPQFIVVDRTTGLVAIAADTVETAAGSVGGGVVLVDTATGRVDPLPGGGGVENLGFARDGELLAITTTDGTTRLWDVESGTPGGLIWSTPGGVNASASWYDDTTESLWLATSDKLIQVPMKAEDWIDRACELVGRDFTQDEWDRFVPGDEPLQSAC